MAWAQAPALGYLDHPPGVAWWIAATGGHPRLAGWLLAPAAWGMLALAGRRVGVPPAQTMAFAAWTPLGLAFGCFATPDVPLVFAWCAVLWATLAGRPLAAGLLFGLCLWAKSTALVAAPGLAWVLGRRAPVALLAAAAIYAPHVAWSLAHEGLPWTFQAGRGITGIHLPEALGGQLLVATPGVFALAALAWWRPGDEVQRRLRALGLPTLAGWLAISLVTRVEANWPVLAWPATLLLLLRARHHLLRRAVLVAGSSTLGAALIWIVVSRAAPTLGPPRDPARLRRCLEGERPVAARYQEKALLDLSGPMVPYLRAHGHRLSEYDRRPGLPVPDCDFLYLADTAALAGRCRGEVSPGRRCGRAVSRCRCEGRGTP